MAEAGMSDIEARLTAVERLARIYRAERLTYLAVCLISLAALLFMLGIDLMRDRGQANWGDALTLLGPSGLITFAGGRVLYMWTQSLRLVAGESIEALK